MLSSYREKLDKINERMRRLAGVLAEAEEKAAEGFERWDMAPLDEAKEMVRSVAPEAAAIDNEIVRTLALFGPEATQLREMVGYLKMTNEAVNTASTIRSYVKHNKALIAGGFDPEAVRASMNPLHRSALTALRTVVEMADISVDEETVRGHFRKVKVEESKGDDLYAVVQKDILRMLSEADIDPLDYMAVLKLARKLERISDHAVNIAKLLLFIKTGGELGDY